MAEDDFGTISVNRGERAREIEVMRQHYRAHREALARMIADAPTELLGIEYQRLIAEIDRSLGRLDELEGGAGVPPPAAVPHPARLKTEPGLRPLVTTPDEPFGEREMPPDLPMGEAEPRSYVPLIILAAVVALGILGWLIWRASSDRGPAPAIVTESDTSASTSTLPDTVAETQAPTQTAATNASSELAATPRAHDYGIIRKGTRATRQFEVTNSSDEPVTMQVARSACRCLYYEYNKLIPPKAKETVTVTIDGAKAKAGDLHETLRISAKSDPSVVTTVEVTAKVQ